MRPAAWAAGIGGAGLVLLALAADWMGVGEAGFGERQVGAVALGGILLVVSVFLRRQIPALPKHVTFGAIWSASAVVLLNTVLAFALINLLAAAVLGLACRSPQPSAAIQSPLQRLPVVRAFSALVARSSFTRLPALLLSDAELQLIYPGWRRAEIAQLLQETRDRGLRFDFYTQSREAEFHGKYVNVATGGFRTDGRASRWPPDPAANNIWVLGGSTAFGYGLSDGETIPAQLEVILARRDPRVQVYNFGQGYFYSVQELTLLESLLQEGVLAPAQVVFIDGINEHFEAPFYSRWIGDLLRSPVGGWLRRPAVTSIPSGSQIVSRWLRTRKLAEGVCHAYRIACLFVWQPAPDWNYDLRYHLLWEPRPPAGSDRVVGASPHYSAMHALVAGGAADLGSDFLWLGDLQHDLRQPLYVDRLHYTAAFAGDIAGSIARALESNRQAAGVDPPLHQTMWLAPSGRRVSSSDAPPG